MNNFTQSYADSRGNSSKATGYELHSFDITNDRGEIRDIKGLVGFFKITESLFASSLVLEVGIRDEVNFFEEFGINGNEFIDISLDVKALDIVRPLNKRFYIVKYNHYQKTDDAQVQAYTFTAVSEHAYVAPLKSISRHVSGSTDSIIETIFKDDLNTPLLVEGDCQSSFDGILTIDNPLRAATKLVEKTFDANNTPFLLFERITGSVHLTSLSELTDLDKNPIYKEFEQKSEFESDPGTDAEYFERSSHMQNITSKLSLSPSYQAKAGTYASENRYIDLGTKTYRKHIFDAGNHLKVENTVSKQIVVTDTQPVVDKRRSEGASPLNKIPGARINYNYVNRYSVNGQPNISELIERNRHLSESYISSYDVCTHKFNTLGDLFLNPGRVLQLRFPKATDPAVYKEFSGKSITETYDKTLSGNYMIFKTTHSFQEGIYTTEVLAKTDSLKQELTL
jgi:hypothetical protein